MGVEIEGLDALQDELEQMAENALGLEGSNEVPFTELMPPAFMAEYTDCESIEAFIDESPWTVESQADFRAIPDDEFDEYVDEHTRFSTWETMLSRAANQWAGRQLR